MMLDLSIIFNDFYFIPALTTYINTFSVKNTGYKQSKKDAFHG